MGKIVTVAPIAERGNWMPKWCIKKFKNQESHDSYWKALFAKARQVRMELTHPDFEKLALALSPRFALGTSVFLGNDLVNVGINELWSLIGGTGGVQYDNTNAFLGVGDSSDAFDAADTDLQAVTNKVRVAMVASYPTYGTSQKIVFKSSFDGDTGNFAWEEFAAFNHTSAGDMLNRKLSSQGTKTSGQVWELTLEISLS